VTWTVREIVRSQGPLMVALTAVSVGSGLILGAFEGVLLAAPSLLVLVPVTIGTAGNLGAVLASRLSTAVHLGTVAFEPTDDVLAGQLLATGALSVTLFPLVGAGAWLLAAATVGAALSPLTVLAVATLAGALLGVVAAAVTVATTYFAYRLELDPDDVVVPVVTSACDVLGVLALFVAVRLLVP
jgi:mgtE-like transporter